MSEQQVEIRADGAACGAFVFTPEVQGRYPGVILFTDAFGIRPATMALARRLADTGYVVLLPDIFHRAQPYDPVEPAVAFASGDVRGAIVHLTSTTDNLIAAADSRAFLDYLLSRGDVEGDQVGLTGYCMGGAIALTVAGTFPDRIAAVAAFHTGGVITEAATSPHLVAPRITAAVYIGGADHDPAYTPEMSRQFDTILTEAGVRHRSEIYADALHGYTMTDFPVYSERATERHWDALLDLFNNNVGVRGE